MRFPGLPRLPRGWSGQPQRRRRRRPLVLGFGAALVLALAALVPQWFPAASASASQPATTVALQPVPIPSAPSRATAPATDAGIPVVGGGSISDPAQVQAIRAVLTLAARGPPYPHRQDGTSFQNREGRLPKQARGFYREFTVPTPGEGDRGARRLVIARDGAVWYTSDHYQTFLRLEPPPVIPVAVSER